MKLIEICNHCKGKGKVPYLQFFSRSCQHCDGAGRTTKHISQFQKENRVQ
ncbi:hypothetical protein [Peribacillus saganii]|nr:hypothetical protein [Peribacillus saganii]